MSLYHLHLLFAEVRAAAGPASSLGSAIEERLGAVPRGELFALRDGADDLRARIERRLVSSDPEPKAEQSCRTVEALWVPFITELRRLGGATEDAEDWLRRALAMGWKEAAEDLAWLCVDDERRCLAWDDPLADKLLAALWGPNGPPPEFRVRMYERPSWEESRPARPPGPGPALVDHLKRRGKL